MFRALLLAIGVTLLLLAAECCLLDHVTLRRSLREPQGDSQPALVQVTPPRGSAIVLLLGGSLLVLGSWRVGGRRRDSLSEVPQSETLTDVPVSGQDSAPSEEDQHDWLNANDRATEADTAYFDDDVDSFFDEDTELD